MFTLFTAWGYEVSILEFTAAIVSLIGVYLGTTGKQITWPWWVASSALYAIWFYQAKYYGSFATQFIFIGFGIWGWFGWGPKGAKPRKLKSRERLVLFVLLIIGSLALWPVLTNIGATSTAIESFGFVGSVLAQLLMVWQKFEAWPVWVIVDAAYTYQYFKGDLVLTGILYLLFTAIAIWGWIRWGRESDKNARG